MPRSIRLSTAAEKDIDSISTWVSQPGAGSRAGPRRRAIAQAIRDLARHPIRSPVDDHDGVRERAVEGYRVLYRVVPDTGSNVAAWDVPKP